ncbi:MAG: phosphatase PAP2 family protein [Elusimicrobiota bacterium]|jgi:membrane-associated phospholipid phosphatase|nr:phosphatase PAP2 family protein [Elusimicrobiota bacterium]
MSKFILFIIIAIFFIQSVCSYSNRDIGDRLIIVLPALVLGFHYKNKEYRREFLLHFLSTNFGNAGLQEVIDEKRPDYKLGDKKDSFPSGHAAAAFQSATFIHEKYGFKYAIFNYIMAIYVGYSRVEAKRHYWHDIGGAFVWSYIMAKIFVSKKDKSLSLSLSPTLDQREYIVSVTKEF